MDIDLGQLQVQPNAVFGYVMFSVNSAQQNFPVVCHAQLVMALNRGDSPNGITFTSKTGVEVSQLRTSSHEVSTSRGLKKVCDYVDIDTQNSAFVSQLLCNWMRLQGSTHH